MNDLTLLLENVTIHKTIEQLVTESLMSLSFIENSIDHGCMPSYETFFLPQTLRMREYLTIPDIQNEESIYNLINYFLHSSETEEMLLALQQINTIIVTLWLY